MNATLIQLDFSMTVNKMYRSTRKCSRVPTGAGWLRPTGTARTEYDAGSGPGQRRVPA